MAEGKRFSWSFNFNLKDILILIVVGVLCFFGYRIYKDLKNEVQRSNVAYQQLSETLARAENNMVSKKELEAFAKATGIDLKKIKEDLRDLGADLTAVGETVASIKGKLEEDQGSDGSTPHDPPEQPEECKLCDIHSYTANTQMKEIKLGEMPFAKVEFDASQEKPWTVKTDDVDVKVTTVMGESDEENVTIFYHEVAMLNKSRPELLDKEFKLKIVSSKFVETVDSTKEFYLWAPHLDLGISNLITFPDATGRYSLGAMLGFSVMAYGRTKSDNDWRFIRLGMGITTKENWFLELDPVQYNLGRFIPLISDLWLGLGIAYDGGWGLGISIGTTL